MMKFYFIKKNNLKIYLFMKHVRQKKSEQVFQIHLKRFTPLLPPSLKLFE